MNDTDGARGTYGERICVYRVLGEKHYVKKPLERPRHRWENNIRLDLKEIDWVFVDWIDVVRDKDKLRALLRMVMN
jgi:hypothetical protein